MTPDCHLETDKRAPCFESLLSRKQLKNIIIALDCSLDLRGALISCIKRTAHHIPYCCSSPWLFGIDKVCEQVRSSFLFLGRLIKHESTFYLVPVAKFNHLFYAILTYLCVLLRVVSGPLHEKLIL